MAGPSTTCRHPVSSLGQKRAGQAKPSCKAGTTIEKSQLENSHKARPTAEVAIVQKALVHHAAAIKLTAGTIAWYARPHAFSEKDEGPE